MKNKPFDFQVATANHVLEAFKNGQRRVLVADEAGLGKTTVASEVVTRVKKELSHEVIDDDGLYCIVYVCCNLQIAKQNVKNLTDDGEEVDLSQSRLSMQHFVYYSKKVFLQANGKDTLVLSLTPATSFNMTYGVGSVDERALMYACLTLLPEFKSQDMEKKLSGLLIRNAFKSWDFKREEYMEKVYDESMAEYREAIIETMNEKFDKTSRQELIRLCNAPQDDAWWNDSYNFIIELRKMFADISLEVLKPDLVIMDEFQKFSSLIGTAKEKETEENKIARKFFADKSTYILLLSATPYKPYTTLEELNKNNCDEQYRDFNRLMDFLYEGEEIDFKHNWKAYSLALKQLGNDSENDLFHKHDSVENILYHVMGRTERTNEGIIKQVIPQLETYLSKGDIASYIQMQHLMDNCREYGLSNYSAPVDYTKSTAFQLSFMDNYKLKDNISTAWRKGARKGVSANCLLLNENSIENYTLKDYHNAQLSYVISTIFGKGKKSTGVETLLWVPASHPYYVQQPNVFTRNASFSKYLIFSSWGMVPKMLSCLLSYEMERRLFHRSNIEYHKVDSQLLKDSSNTRALTVMQTVCVYLADLYNPENCYGMPLSAIRQQIRKEIKVKLNKIEAKRVKRVSSQDIYMLFLKLDGKEVEVRNIPKNADEILADMAIGAPAMCLYRVFQKLDKTSAIALSEEVAKAFVGMFNSRQGIAAVRANCKKYNNYFQKVIEYCIQGNLQSVLDEFVHMIGENETPSNVAKRMVESFVPSYHQQVNTIQNFGTKEKFSMRKNFAVDFGSSKQTEKMVNHATNVRSAFNSPFRPFVLVSTSVGQEGLDFHWYCRKIVHWNLPSNPQDLEQREGRVNRYKCLAVRRNVAKLYKNVFSWSEIFRRATEELKGTNPEMVPCWYLPLRDERFKNIEPEMIERIVPMYPLSEDKSRYNHLIKVLSLYRLTMGQPRQEELLTLLAGKVSQDEARRLLFNLCPYYREKQSGS